MILSNYSAGLDRSRIRFSGFTLIEVLMALLIMSIGVIAVATLFPISVLRALESNKITHATSLRYNAEAIIDRSPEIIHNPITPGAAPDYMDSEYADGSLSNGSYVIDPYGWAYINTNFPATPDFRNYFGNDGTAAAGVIERFNANRFFGSDLSPVNPSVSQSLALVGAPDNWKTLVKETPSTLQNFTVAGNTNTYTFNTGITDLGLSAISSDLRIVLIDNTGRNALTLPVNAISGQDVDFDVPYDIANVTNVRIIHQQNYYSWMLTVRKANLPTEYPSYADVVVFYKRKFQLDSTGAYPVHELIYPVTQQTFNKFGVTWGANPKPVLEKGGFLFDADNARWYKIMAFDETSTTANIQTESRIIGFISNAIFVPDVVDVYRLDLKKID